MLHHILRVDVMKVCPFEVRGDERAGGDDTDVDSGMEVVRDERSETIQQAAAGQGLKRVTNAHEHRITRVTTTRTLHLQKRIERIHVMY